MDFSNSQRMCLAAMGIPLLQSKPTITSTVSSSKLASNAQAEQPAALLQQLTLAIDYCRQHAESDLVLSWSIDNSLNGVERQDQQLMMPDLTKVFGCATLKKQLWEQMNRVYQ